MLRLPAGTIWFTGPTLRVRLIRQTPQVAVSRPNNHVLKRLAPIGTGQYAENPRKTLELPGKTAI